MSREQLAELIHEWRRQHFQEANNKAGRYGKDIEDVPFDKLSPLTRAELLHMAAEIERLLAHAILDANKHARAEVLAACSERLDLFMENIGNYSDEFGKKAPFKTWDRDDWEAAALRLLSDVQDALDQLQPAAKDLEELLREEREKFIVLFQEAPNPAKGTCLSEYCDWYEKVSIAIGEEKARAEGKG